VWPKNRILASESPCADFPFPHAAETPVPIANRSDNSVERRSLSSDKDDDVDLLAADLYAQTATFQRDRGRR
jgi:hypothetical protein